MKTSILTVKTLLAKVKRANQLVSNSMIVPIIENLYFTNGKIISTDLHNHLVLDNSGFEGEFLIPAKQLAKVLAVLDKNAEIDLQTNSETFKTTLNVVGTNKTFTLVGENVCDFPPLPKCDLEIGNITGIDISNIAKALPYCSKDDLRPAMKCVNIGTDIVATDGHRMMFFPIDGKLSDLALVDSSSAKLLCDFTEAKVFKTSSHLSFVDKTETLICRIVDERYPQYAKALPQNNPIKITVPTKSIKETVKLALLSANSTTNQCVLNVFADKLNVSSNDLDFGTSFADTLDAKVLGVETTFTIGINGKFFLEYINQTDKDSITIKASMPNRAMILNGEHLIMPITLK